jgi:hypothetical protein
MCRPHGRGRLASGSGACARTTTAAQTLGVLRGPDGQPVLFLATLHNDHTPNRHVHAIALVKGRLSAAHLYALRRKATAEARLQRRLLDRVRRHPRLFALSPSRYLSPSAHAYRRGRGPRVISPRLQAACWSCGYGQLTGIPSYRLYCPSCRVRLDRNNLRGFGLGVLP